MWKKDLLKEYNENVKKIVKSAKKTGLSDEEIKRLLKQSFSHLQTHHPNKGFIGQIIQQNGFKISVLVTLFFSLFVYVLLNFHTPTSSIVLRNVQGLTYPALKIVRTLSVPIIKLFPSLTDLYDESCLVENPYFYLSDMECWPCESVHSVMDLTGVEGIETFNKLGEGTPFIVKTNKHEVSFKNLQELYKNHSFELTHDSTRLKLSNTDVRRLNELFASAEVNLSSNIHIHWRINKMTAARIIRKLFPKPHFLPERSGQAVERFLHIDGPTAEPYTLPNTECSYVFLIQGSGERTIALKPSNECEKKCRTVSVLMKPSYVLLYNWWYWRPVSLPTKNDTNLSISYINSYC